MIDEVKVVDDKLTLIKYEMYSSGVKYGWESACYKIMDYVNDCQATGVSDSKVISNILWFCITNVSKAPLTSDKIPV